jgi:hypothetical protein
MDWRGSVTFIRHQRLLAAVHGIGANDEIEAMLAVQMVATHFAATRALRRLKGRSDTPAGQRRKSRGETAANLRGPDETLQRYRGKGQQKVTVEHVHVHIGGQAIVGSVSHSGGGRENDQNRGAPRCLAQTRRGTPCQSPAVAGKTRCRMHGGAAGSGAPKGKRNGKYRHGGFTTEAIDERRRLASLLRDSRDFLSRLR